jgi:hypothetical protein
LEKKKAGERSDRNFGEEKTFTPKTAERLAEQYKVNERTIREDEPNFRPIALVLTT